MAELAAQDLTVLVERLLADKERGVDCDADGSAHVKRAIRRELLRTEEPFGIGYRLMLAFPLESDEVLGEDPGGLESELWIRAGLDLAHDPE